MSKKTTTNQSQNYKNDYQFLGAPVTTEIQSVLDEAKKPGQIDPSIFGRYAAMKEDVTRSYADPFGANTSADVRQKAQLSRMLNIDKERDVSLRSAFAEMQQGQFAKKLTAASLTAPQLVQTGGNSAGTQMTKQSDPFGTIMGGIQAGAQIGSTFA